MQMKQKVTLDSTVGRCHIRHSTYLYFTDFLYRHIDAALYDLSPYVPSNNVLDCY